MGLVESWWNGRWGGLARERVRLYQKAAGWQVEHVWGRDSYEVRDFDSEEEARRVLAVLKTGPWDWQRVDKADHPPF